MRALVLALTLALAPTVAAAHGRTDAPSPRTVNAPVSVSGAPRSLVSLVVPVPTQLEDAGHLSFAVEISGRVDVLGRQFGELTTLPGQRHRPVLLTIRVPGDALVGLLDVADVVFTAEDGRQVVVPVILRVPSVLAIRVTGQRELVNVAAGDRVELAYRVQNLGNAPETFVVELDAPADWRRTVPRTVSVGPFGSTEIPVSLRVAPGAAGNDHLVSVTLRRASGDTAEVGAWATMLRSAPGLVRPSGLRLDPFVAVAATATGVGTASGLVLQGPISRGVRLFAQASPLPSSGNQDAVLAQSGALRLPFLASVSTDTWNVQAGATQINVSELGGMNLGGQGVTAYYDDGTRNGRVIVARPGFDGRDRGSFLGAAAGQQTAFGQFTGFASVLKQQSSVFDERQLTAIGADYVSRPVGTLLFIAGAAVRAHDQGTGLGVRAQVLHERKGESLRLRVSHAPGGSGAFALQSDEIMLDGRRDLTARVSVSGEYFRNADRGGQFSDVIGSGLSIGPRVLLGDASSLSVRAFHQTSDVTATNVGIGRFGTTNTGGTMTGFSTLGAWDLMADLNVMDVVRRAELFSGAEDEVRALQSVANLTANREVSSLGMLGLGASLQSAESGVGLPERATSVFARWTGLPLFVFGQLVLASSEARLFHSDVAGGSQTALRFGAQTQFRNGTMIDGSVSRSPFVRDANGRMGWVAALRVGVTAEVLAGDRLRTPGVVFVDSDADGVRDPEERGVAGVQLRYGNARVTTGRDGRYRLPANLRGRLRVDPTSLPRGLVVAPRVALDSAERRDIPLLATGSRDIVLELQADAELRIPNVDLSKSDVWLRDADGFEWVGEHMGGGRFRFSEVPVGTYAVRLDFSRLSEPVRAEEPTFEVRTGQSEAVRIQVRGRTVRMISPPRGREGGAGRGIAPRGLAPRSAVPQAAPETETRTEQTGTSEQTTTGRGGAGH